MTARDLLGRTYMQVIVYRLSCEIKIAEAGEDLALLLRYGKLVIRKLKSSRL